MENSIASRLRTLISTLGLSDSQFADQCSISRATLSLLLSGKNKKISDVLLSQIHNAFPNVSIIWLLFDEGDPFNKINNEDKAGKSLENLFDDAILQSYDKEDLKNQNLRPFNQLEETIKLTVLKAIESFMETNGFVKEKNSDCSNKKKVRQITVYYDDSTFETFTPQFTS